MGNLHPGAKTKNGKKIHPCANCAFLLQVDVISKRENPSGYIGRQVNSLTGLSIVIFFSPNPGEVNNCGRSHKEIRSTLLKKHHRLLLKKITMSDSVRLFICNR